MDFLVVLLLSGVDLGGSVIETDRLELLRLLSFGELITCSVLSATSITDCPGCFESAATPTGLLSDLSTDRLLFFVDWDSSGSSAIGSFVDSDGCLVTFRLSLSLLVLAIETLDLEDRRDDRLTLLSLEGEVTMVLSD